MKKPQYMNFEIEGTTYRSGRIDAITQSKMVRKLATLLPALGEIRDHMRINPGVSLIDIDVGMLSIIGKAMATLPDESHDFIVATFMRAVDRDQTGQGNWLPVWDDVRKNVLFDDIDLRMMLLLSVKVFQHNLSSFTSALGLNSEAVAA